MKNSFATGSILALWLLLVAASLAGAPPAFAQEQPSSADSALPEAAAPNGDSDATAPVRRDAPYEDRLVRLAEIVGSVHYLETLCQERPSTDTDSAIENGTAERDNPAGSRPSGTPETDWRTLMGALIETEAPEPERNAKLTAAFNRGYRSFASVYTRCTGAARTATERYRSEGATLATEIIARFGN